MPMDTKRVRQFLRERHEVDEDLPDLKLSNLAAVQTALLCDIADSLRLLSGEALDRAAGRITLDPRAMGLHPQELYRGIERAINDTKRHGMERDMRMQKADQDFEYRGTRNADAGPPRPSFKNRTL